MVEVEVPCPNKQDKGKFLYFALNSFNQLEASYQRPPERAERENFMIYNS